MEGSTDEENRITEPLLAEDSRKGGIRAIPTILGLETIEQVTSYGLPPNMILYLTKDYHMEVIAGNTILYLWGAASGIMPVLGAFIADSYLGRFQMIGFGSMFSILGLIVLWLTAVIPQARPPSCKDSDSNCMIPASNFQLFVLCLSFGLISIGTGGIRSSALAFGADQLKTKDGQRNSSALERYFTLYYGLSALAIFIALSGIVYVQDQMGWNIGFGIPAVLMFFGILVFFMASPLYIKLKVKSNLLAGLLQVVVASYRKRHVKLSPENSTVVYHHNKGSVLIHPSERLRCLNKACVMVNQEQELTPEETAKDPWSLCTVSQVEELKMLIRIIPLWSTGMLMFSCISPSSITVLQAKTMNRKFWNFEIPAGSFSTFTIIGIILWVVLYKRVILPIATRITGKPADISTKNRMGLAVCASFLAQAVAATVETVRRKRAIQEGYLDKPDAVINMSAAWLIPQAFLIGIAEAFSVIAQNQFYYSEFPRSMSSIASSIYLLGISISNLVASLIQNSIDEITEKGGKESWISSNINKGHYDYYYWILAGIALVNVFYFVVCIKAYGATKEEIKDATHDDDDDGEQ